VGTLVALIALNYIKCVPSSYYLRITYYRVVRLASHTLLVLALAARLGSLKQAAIKAKCNTDCLVKKRVINFSYAIPFTRVLLIIKDSF